MDLAELLGRLSRLRRATVNGRRVPHKPLLLLWLFARLQQRGSSTATYAEVEQPVSDLINEFGPSVRSPSALVQRAAMPFVHLEREIWEVVRANGEPLPTSTPERRKTLLAAGARGSLRPDVEAVLAEPANLVTAAALLLDEHFTPTLAKLIVDALGLDLDIAPVTRPSRRRRHPGFAEAVKRAYAYQCAMCGFDGALGRIPVALEAAHVRWHSQGGPDELTNGLCLCELHHALFDLGVLGLTDDRTITVSPLYVARTSAGRAVEDLHTKPIPVPRMPGAAVDLRFIRWHTLEVFKLGHHAA